MNLLLLIPIIFALALIISQQAEGMIVDTTPYMKINTDKTDYRITDEVIITGVVGNWESVAPNHKVIITVYTIVWDEKYRHVKEYYFSRSYENPNNDREVTIKWVKPSYDFGANNDYILSTVSIYYDPLLSAQRDMFTYAQKTFTTQTK